MTCDGGTTRKTLWRLFDGALIESVLMRYPDRITMCVSSQAGCGMNCPFCATGQAGLTRNMSTAEIVEQVVAGARALARGEIPGGPGRVTNIVFMGMGEPLANYKAVIGAVRRMIDPAPDGLGISAARHHRLDRRPGPRDRQARRRGPAGTLAVSLHAPDDELRDELVPINTRWKVAEVLDAAWDYAAKTKRRVSIEYALIKDINDQAWRADLLGRLLKDKLVHVNLIPLNPTPGSKWTASRPGGRAGVRPPPGGPRRAGDGPRHPWPGDRRRLRPARRRRIARASRAAVVPHAVRLRPRGADRRSRSFPRAASPGRPAPRRIAASRPICQQPSDQPLSRPATDLPGNPATNLPAAVGFVTRRDEEEPGAFGSYGVRRCRSRGNRVVCRMLAAPVSREVQRSRPMAKPPCGGMPWAKAAR